MYFKNLLSEDIWQFLPFLGTIALIAVVLWGLHLLLIGRHQDFGSERLFPRQLAMLGFTFIGILAIALSLPVSESTRNQIIALLGLVLSGVLAFSSGGFFSSLMAGIMLRITKPFRAGDYVTVGNHFGRIVQSGLLDTEIQTENREMVTLPNTFLVANPISVVQSSSAVVSTVLSLGYDIHHAKVEVLLLEAAGDCGLVDPFVQVKELGNFSITYKISGVLVDAQHLLTTRSQLCKCILDTLHRNRIEIVSPAFMSQRQIAENTQFIPVHVTQNAKKREIAAEDILFDKANEAEQIEKKKNDLIEGIESSRKALETATEEEKKQIQETIKRNRQALKDISEPKPEQN